MIRHHIRRLGKVSVRLYDHDFGSSAKAISPFMDIETLPVAQYGPGVETVLEGSGVDVDIDEPLSLDELWHGNDNQLAAAARAASLL
jgi:hypothetical protein